MKRKINDGKNVYDIVMSWYIVLRKKFADTYLIGSDNISEAETRLNEILQENLDKTDVVSNRKFNIFKLGTREMLNIF